MTFRGLRRTRLVNYSTPNLNSEAMESKGGFLSVRWSFQRCLCVGGVAGVSGVTGAHLFDPCWSCILPPNIVFTPLQPFFSGYAMLELLLHRPMLYALCPEFAFVIAHNNLEFGHGWSQEPFYSSLLGVPFPSVKDHSSPLWPLPFFSDWGQRWPGKML